MTKLTVALEEINMHLNRMTEAVHLLGYSRDVDHFRNIMIEELKHIQGIIDYQIKCSIVRDEPISLAKFMNVDTTMAEINRSFAELEKGGEEADEAIKRVEKLGGGGKVNDIRKGNIKQPIR